jgi:alpha-ribazole phosphatase
LNIQQEILLIRHSSVAHPRGFCYGNLDVDVSDNFQKEASELKAKLKNYAPDKVYSSPLQRCTKLTDVLFDNYETDDRLKELNYGLWEGLTWEEINVPENSNWIFHHPNTVLENGESFELQQKRVVEFFKEVEQTNDKKIALVVHGGVIRSLISHLLGITLLATKSFKIHYVAQVKFVKENDKWRMSGLTEGV